MSTKKRKKKKISANALVLWIILTIVVVVLVVLLNRCLPDGYEGKKTDGGATEATDITSESDSVSAAVSEKTPVIGAMEDVEVVLGKCLQIINIGSYTGAFVEDGTNEIVSGVLMLVVTNISETDLQYAQITLPTEEGEAQFSISTLPAGESAVILEQNRMPYTGQEDCSMAVISNIATFDETLSLCENQLELQILDGAINVTNISGEDITGDVVIYYKNAADDLYYGGITYRVRIEGGMAADEIQQIMAGHFSDSGSKIMFVTVGK
ncbi:MAG: hypothetical protein J6C37_07205 [Roseburia sp.]|nr:hypothetical protein [Roseburia sp.]